MSMKNRHVLGEAVRHLILIILALYTLAPLLFLFVNAFKSNNEIIASPVALPEHWTLQYIKTAMEAINFGKALGLTFIITFFSILLLVIVSSFAAWAMVRSKTILSNIVFLCFTAAMLVPFQSLMYPLLSVFEKMGLKNVQGLILMYGGFGLSMSVFLYHGFIKSVPASLEEAAVLDGANLFQMFFKVVFPLLKGTTVTVIVLNGMWIWNDYLLPYLVLDLKKYTTIPIAVQYLKGGYGSVDMGAMMGVLVLAIIPIIVFYLFCQKYIIEGVVAGAVKG